MLNENELKWKLDIEVINKPGFKFRSMSSDVLKHMSAVINSLSSNLFVIP